MLLRHCLSLVLVISLANVARAQEEPSAEALIERALALRAAGDEAGAHPLLVEAFAQSGTPRARAQLAFSHQALGHWRAAYEGLVAALASDDPWIARRRDTLEGALEIVRGHVALLVVEGTPAGAEVRVDGEPRGALPLPSPLVLEPGRVALEVRAEGHTPEARAVVVPAGMTTTERVSLAATPGAAGGSALPWVLGGVSLAVAIGGAVTLGLARVDATTVEGAEVGTSWASVRDAAERVPILEGVGVTAMAVGAAGLAIAIVIAALEGDGESRAARALATGTARF